MGRLLPCQNPISAVSVNMGNGTVGTQVVVLPEDLLWIVAGDDSAGVDIPIIWGIYQRLGLCCWCLHCESFGSCSGTSSRQCLCWEYEVH